MIDSYSNGNAKWREPKWERNHAHTKLKSFRTRLSPSCTRIGFCDPRDLARARQLEQIEG
jgi:hypothetical protein